MFLIAFIILVFVLVFLNKRKAKEQEFYYKEMEKDNEIIKKHGRTKCGAIIHTLDNSIFIATCLMLFVILGSFILGLSVIESRTYDERIALYEEYNSDIEVFVESKISAYLMEKNETISSLKVENLLAAATVYPELNSDELVTKQIDVYLSNKEIIKDFKEKKIKASLNKWLLYFGS